MNQRNSDMVANFDRRCPLARRILAAASALALGCSLSAAAQTTSASQITTDGQSYSSSSTYLASLGSDFLPPGAQPAAASAALASPAPQYGGQRTSSYPNYESRWSHLAVVAGGGFTAPIGNATHGYETWGYNLDFGGGWNFSKRFGVLFEYQFDRNKIPGATIATVGAQAGNIHTHLFLFNPVYYFAARKTTGGYVTGGVGYSRKVTNFSDLVAEQECYSFYFCGYGYAPVTVASFSSNQLAADAGIG